MPGSIRNYPVLPRRLLEEAMSRILEFAAHYVSRKCKIAAQAIDDLTSLQVSEVMHRSHVQNALCVL